MYRLYRLASIGLAVTLLSGCATRKARTSQPRFPQPKAAASNGATPESLSDYMQKVRHLSVNARPLNKNEAAETLETRDPAIAAELLQVSNQPTADRYRSLAESYRERGVLDAAYRNFNRAVALNPRDAAAYEAWPESAHGDCRRRGYDAHRAVYYAPQMASARNTARDAGAASMTRTRKLAGRLEPNAAHAVQPCYLAFVEGRMPALRPARRLC